ncbi:MAG: hypothetical protein A2381_01885 [Bdellovibrionales bacterium RIFOXYB1_FULL_37_110]|nr:MAG: hypothetical protein A2417_09835 [Bdellovibrionales bacterium RIFOXYC1_FULL_37_79]OFZ58966.1 MAG: hypothetical protein A2381_01885 [Bdellovibrionales bacterium RIFOXYB1_FULL_37_110]OFZ64588.1 MAG: hypothetical protein A2577_13050 [Bdellovibrionales bacterium RIFOXYD1_FULL_36_51]
MKKILLAILVLGSLSSYTYASAQDLSYKCEGFYGTENIGELADMFQSEEVEQVILILKYDKIVFEAKQYDQTLLLYIYNKNNLSERIFKSTSVPTKNENASLELETQNGKYTLTCIIK